LKNLSLNSRIKGSFSNQVLLELFRNSGYFAIVNILLEILLESPIEYLIEPDLYAIVFAVIFQAYWLAKWDSSPNKRKFLGNLIGPTIYSIIEVALEGWLFFQSPHHIAYWVFALFIGSLQYFRTITESRNIITKLIILENTLKSFTIFVMYVILENYVKRQEVNWTSFFSEDFTHTYLLMATLFIGISVGIADAISEKYLYLLKKTSLQLKDYSEWLFGKNLLKKAIIDPNIIALNYQERTILFMDIRGFTQWSEHKDPKKVITLLVKYFTLAEKVFYHHKAVKIKFTGDEVMAIFSDIESALSASLFIQNSVKELLAPENMGVGIGMNYGRVMEGIIGADDIRSYDVMGDVVNTAKRIEGQTKIAEILVSQSIFDNVDKSRFVFGEQYSVKVKGKIQELMIYQLLS